MFILKAQKNSLEMRAWETLTSGTVNENHVRFQFSADWDGLSRTAVFAAGDASRSILLGEDETCVIPWEVLAAPDLRLLAGVYGVGENGEMVLPTVWADLGKIYPGATPGDPAQPPTPDLLQQALGASRDHQALTHRDAAGQHPIHAVTGLRKALEQIPAPVEPLTNSDLEELLK